MRRWALSALAMSCAACGLSSEGSAPPASAASTGVGASGGGSSATSSSASSSAASGGGDAGASSTGAGGAKPEDCTNGADDDQDGQADCDDPDCLAAGFECLEGPPGADFAALPNKGNCDAPLVEASLLDCSSCACDETSPGSCSATITTFVEPTCTVGAPFGAYSTAQCGDESCCNNPNAPNDLYYDATAALTMPRTCAAPNATEDPGVSLACRVPKAGVCQGGACVPKTMPAVACVLVDALVCPAPFTAKKAQGAEGDPTDACSCACAAGPTTCPTVSLFDDDNCGTLSAVVTPGTCTLSARGHSFAAIPQGGCVGSGAPQSAPSAPVKTLCCLP